MTRWNSSTSSWSSSSMPRRKKISSPSCRRCDRETFHSKEALVSSESGNVAPPTSLQERDLVARVVVRWLGRETLRNGGKLSEGVAPDSARALDLGAGRDPSQTRESVSYTHLRAHETPEHLVCRLL